MNAGEKIEETLRELASDAEINFERIAVTPEQIADWDLPTRPTKATDTRAKDFGEISVELDAIEPSRLRAIVQEAIEYHLPPRHFEVLKAAEDSGRDLLPRWSGPSRGATDAPVNTAPGDAAGTAHRDRAGGRRARRCRPDWSSLLCQRIRVLAWVHAGRPPLGQWHGLPRRVPNNPPGESNMSINLDDPDGDKLIYELSKLSEAAYQRRRKDAARELGMRVDALDKIIRHMRVEAEENAALPHWNVEPWETEVAGAELLDAIEGMFRRYIVLPKGAAEGLALWTLHAWTMDAGDVSPFMVLVSPTKRCGKTSALIVLYYITPRSELASNSAERAVPLCRGRAADPAH